MEYFKPSGGRSVLDGFIRKNLKNLPEVKVSLIDHLKIVQNTPTRTLREQQRIEGIQDEIFSYKFQTKHHWVRLLLATYPGDEDIVILVPLLKKTNKINPDDTKQAKRNLVMFKAQRSNQKK